MTLPVFGVELARDRLSKRHLARATLTSEMYAPAAAVDAGFLDRVTGADVLFSESFAEADRLGALDSAAFARTKRRLRTATIALVRDTLASDMRNFRRRRVRAARRRRKASTRAPHVPIRLRRLTDAPSDLPPAPRPPPQPPAAPPLPTSRPPFYDSETRTGRETTLII